MDFDVTFWGVRGSRSVPGPKTAIYGGNTSCVQVQIGKRLLIMDAGTGICNLAQALMETGNSVKGEIFITHTHWDHIQGFPFFTPSYLKGNHFTIYGQNKINYKFPNLMRGQMLFPHFPVSFEQLGACLDFREVDSGNVIDLGDEIKLSVIHNNHPGGSISYRLDHGGKSCCYITDTEHYSIVDINIKEFIKGADLVIYDTHFTDEEYAGFVGFPAKIGWGHSTWQEGVKLVQAAGAKKLVLFHHATHRNDDDMERVEGLAKERFDNCVAAREGMTIHI